MTVRKKVLSLVAGGLIALGRLGPTAAMAAGGGIFNYGFRYDKHGKQSTVYSHYYHGSKTHRASTTNGYGEYSCKHTRPGEWAKTSQRAHPRAVDKANWAHRTCP